MIYADSNIANDKAGSINMGRWNRNQSLLLKGL